MKNKTLNYKVLRVFAPILILIGILGFVVPADQSLNGGAASYNIFHLVFGAFGLFLVFAKNEKHLRLFNLGFGAVDLYQAAASYFHLFPETYFQWTSVDDFLHVVIGAILVGVGLYGYKYRADNIENR